MHRNQRHKLIGWERGGKMCLSSSSLPHSASLTHLSSANFLRIFWNENFALVRQIPAQTKSSVLLFSVKKIKHSRRNSYTDLKSQEVRMNRLWVKRPTVRQELYNWVWGEQEVQELWPCVTFLCTSSDDALHSMICKEVSVNCSMRPLKVSGQQERRSKVSFIHIDIPQRVKHLFLKWVMCQ